MLNICFPSTVGRAARRLKNSPALQSIQLFLVNHMFVCKEPGRFSLLLMFVVLAGMIGFGAPRADAQMLYQGEILEYDVSYLGFTLGTIVIKTTGKETIDGDSTVVVQAEMKSRPGLPYMSIDVLYKSWLDPSVKYARKFYASEQINEDPREYTKYEFEYPKNYFRIETGTEDAVKQQMKFETSTRWNDGLSLFFLARQFLNIKRHIGIPTIIQNDTVRTAINFVGTAENVEIDAVEYEVSTTYFKGNADWEGIYGVTGRFEGWFSADEARVPIRAKMKVYLGSVDIQLTKWTRGNWMPPKAKG